MLINSRTIWDGPKWLTVSCFLGDFGLKIILHFIQASHQKACQPNFDHFVCRCSSKNLDFRSYTLIGYKIGKTVTDIHQDLTITFTESCPTLRTIQRWGSEIQCGTFTLEKGVSSGRPLETGTPEKIACVKELIEFEQIPQMSTREAAADLSLPLYSSLWYPEERFNVI